MSTSLTKLRPWHLEVADLLIANPTLKQGEVAKMLGKSQAWLSIVMNGDMFKEYMAKRRADIMDPILTSTVEDRYAAVAEKATDEFLRRMELAPSSISNKHLIDAMGTAAGALGMGPKTAAPAPAGPQLYIVPLPGGAPLQSAADWQAAAGAYVAREAQKTFGEVVDVPVEAAPAK